MHKIPAQIRFNDADMLGHLNNSAYLQLMDMAKYRYIMDVLGSSFNLDGKALVVANINCDFLAPTFIDEHIEVHTSTSGIGEHSLSLEQEIVNSDTGEVKTKARTIMVAYDTVGRSSIEILPEWRKAIEEYESRNQEN